MALYFPAPKWDQTSYKQGAPEFGHRRGGGTRIHAACDLYAPLESEVKAVDDGYVVEIVYGFAGNTDSIAVFHKEIGVIRYAEVLSIPKKFTKLNEPVKAGDVIGLVGKAVAGYPPMLHFELFDGTGKGALSDKVNKIEYYNEGVLKNGKYRRRADLMNPNKFLDRLWLEGKK